MINKPLYVPGEHELSEKFDIGLHRAEVMTIGSPDDLQEPLCRVSNEGGQVRYRIEGCGHENNSIMVYFTNVKTAGAALSLRECTLSDLCCRVQKLDSGESRFVGVGSAVRTEEKLQWPGLLLDLSRNGQVPGVGYTTVTERTKNDISTTPVLPYTTHSYKIENVTRNLFHLDGLNAHATNSMLNAIEITSGRLSEGSSVHFALCLPSFSAGLRLDITLLSEVLSNSFETCGAAYYLVTH